MQSDDKLLSHFRKKTDDELLKIFNNNETNEYEEIAYDTIEQILDERDLSYTPREKKVVMEDENQGGFWSFDKMVSGNLITILYVLGLIAIIISGIILIINGSNSRYGGEMLIVIGVGIITIGNLLWRIICEGMIVIFKIFEKLNQIEKKL